MDVRKTALSILRDAEQKEKYVALALNAALENLDCDERDRALLTTLVYGVTERRVTLDYYIAALSDRPIEKIGARLVMTLRLGLYQLLYLDRIPPHAAVSETVRLGKSQGERAFLNGILRGYLKKKEEIALPTKKYDRLAVQYSFPRTMVELLCDNLGDQAEQTLAALAKQPPMTIAVNTLYTDRETALKKLTSAGLSAENCRYSPRGIRIRGNVSYDTLCAVLGEGNFFVQDEASQIAITVLAPKKGERGADACACPGSKSFHAALAMENEGEIFAFDLHESKLPLITSGADRLGISMIRTAARDSRTAEKTLAGKCDFVICDVPCSGLGVMAKKPEIRYHDADAWKELAPLGYEILCASVSYLKNGGRLLYSTCTLTKAENEDNFTRFLAEHPEYTFAEFTLGDLQSKQGMLTLYPSAEHDGFFISLLTKR